MANDNDAAGAKRLPPFDTARRRFRAYVRQSIDSLIDELDRLRGWLRATYKRPPVAHLRSHIVNLSARLPFGRFDDHTDNAPGQVGATTVSNRFKSAWATVESAWLRLTTPNGHSVASPAENELRSAIRSYRGAFIGLGFASGLANVLTLAVPIFMLQIYDRVLPSRSLPTLVGLGLLALAMLAFQGVLDLLRGRLVLRIGRALNEQLGARVLDTVMCLPLQGRSATDGLQPIRDLDNVRGFTSSIGLTALIDLPWVPLYIIVCFLFHPWMGIAVLVGALVICSLTLVTERLTREPSQATTVIAASRHVLAETARRNAAVIRALGMRGRMIGMWAAVNERYLTAHQSASDMVIAFGSLSRTLRLVMQCAVLAVGAYLVINQEATAGVMLAATILSARALAPVEMVIANWKAFVTARQSWQRLADVLAAVPPAEQQIELPTPRRNLRLIAVTVVPPGAAAAALHEVSLSLTAGSVLGVIGPSGSGKSALARAIVGVWKPVRGTIRLDAATLDQWNPDMFGRFIGYLPQEIDLFDGTVAQNISRFEPQADPVKLIAAASAAGIHEVILRLPRGYKTEVGEGGALLSGGQRQRIALARALFGDPFLVVLDEPNSNLDTTGEHALACAIHGVRARGGIAVVIAHRPSVVAAADHLLVLNEGRMQAFGPRDQVLAQLQGAPAAKPIEPVPSPRPVEADAARKRKAR